MKVEFRPATESDAIAFDAVGFREADAREARRLGFAPGELLLRSVRDSAVSVAGLADGEVQSIFGVSDAGLLGGIGIVWMVAHAFVERVPLAFLRHCRRFLRVFLEYYPRLENIVDAENAVTIGWLKHMGFVVETDRAVVTPLGYPFHRFWMEA